MRWIDRWLGLVVCAALSVSRRLAIRPPRLKDDRHAPTIVLIKFWGLGSILLATPAFRSLRACYPKATIVMLTFEQNRELCERLAPIDEVLCVRRDRLIHLVSDTVRAIRRLRRRGVDLVINFEFFARYSSITASALGAVRHFEFHSDRFWKGHLASHRIALDESRHVRENFIALARAAGAHLEDDSLVRPTVSNMDQLEVDLLLARQDHSSEPPLVCLNINAGELAPERAWPEARYLEVARRLLGRQPIELVLIGGPVDREDVEAFARQLDMADRVTVAAGRLSIGGLAALFERSRLLITNDSGPLHLAEAVELPTISFFGPDTPRFYGPWGAQHRVFYTGLPCSPCMSPHNAKAVNCQIGVRCLRDIPVEDVVETAESMLEECLAVSALRTTA